MAFSIRILSILCVFSLFFHRSIADSSVCARLGVDSFVNGIRSQCPAWIERFSPEELEKMREVIKANSKRFVSNARVHGDKLDQALEHALGNAYHSIFFYASWCPFSMEAQPIFYALTSMFPQIRHLTVEESSAIPSVFSRYGIHSFPSILITNRTARMQYHGPKDLNSLVNFYKEMTGLNPVAYFAVEESSNPERRSSLNLRNQSLGEIIKSEPYLAFSILFICLKAFACFIPMIMSRIKTLLFMYALHANLGILGEWDHLLERVLHVNDLEKLWSKLRLCNKTRNFQKGAKNARVWASSFASVSLGESSSSRD